MSSPADFKGQRAQKTGFFAFSVPSAAFSTKMLAPVALAVLLSHCSPPQDTPAQQTAQAPQGEAVEATDLGLGVDLDNMDRSVRLQDDFFEYVNGGWVEQNPIPSDRSRWGSFDELREAAEADVLAILREAAAEEAEQGTLTQKIGDMFTAFMDAEAIEALGVAPLTDGLAQIDALSSHDQLLNFWAGAAEHRRMAPFGYSISQDQGQSDQYITTVGQSGLGLPDRDYYVSDNERYQAIREQYVTHIS